MLAAAGVVVWLLVSTRPQPPRIPPEQRAQQVSVITARLAPVTRTWRGYGTARAKDAADVAAQVAAEVVERPERIEAGNRVAKGDMIVALDDEEFRRRLSSAREAIRALEAQVEGLDVEKASLEESVRLAEEAVRLTQREVERAKAAVEEGAATPGEVERLQRELTQTQRERTELQQRLSMISVRRRQLEAQIRERRAEASLAELNVQRCRIAAPFDGAIQEVHVDPGERVSVGEVVARLVDLSRIEVPLRLPISAGAQLDVGDAVRLRADSPGGRSWRAEVARIAPEADSRTRTLTAFVEVSQSPEPGPGALLPGQFVIAEISAGQSRRRIVVPRAAVRGDRVWVVAGEDDRVEPRRVRVAHYLEARFEDVAPRETQWAVIESGLEPGEQVIVSNFESLEAGRLVEATDAGAGDSEVERASESGGSALDGGAGEGGSR